MKNLMLSFAVSLALFAMCANSAPPSNLSDLATSLSALRDACAQQASTAHADISDARFKQSLDDQVAQQKSEMDARVYGVGHGSRETRDYLLDQMQGNAKASETKAQSISDKATADQKAIRACVADAVARGKVIYTAFKKHHKRSSSDAEALATAWLTNLQEISFDTPQGSQATDAAWKTAKAHAELSSL